MFSRILEIQQKINTHSQAVVKLCNEAAAILEMLSHPAAVEDNNAPTSRRKRRTRAELRTLIEAAVDTFEADTTDKLIAEKAGISIARIYKEPCATFLTEARKEYRKKQNAERAADYKSNRQNENSEYD